MKFIFRACSLVTSTIRREIIVQNFRRYIYYIQLEVKRIKISQMITRPP